jgi:hypothetical protein
MRKKRKDLLAMSLEDSASEEGVDGNEQQKQEISGELVEDPWLSEAIGDASGDYDDQDAERGIDDDLDAEGEMDDGQDTEGEIDHELDREWETDDELDAEGEVDDDLDADGEIDDDE